MLNNVVLFGFFCHIIPIINAKCVPDGDWDNYRTVVPETATTFPWLKLLAGIYQENLFKLMMISIIKIEKKLMMISIIKIEKRSTF